MLFALKMCLIPYHVSNTYVFGFKKMDCICLCFQIIVLCCSVGGTVNNLMFLVVERRG